MYMPNPLLPSLPLPPPPAAPQQSADYERLPHPRTGSGWQSLTEMHNTDLNTLMVEQDFKKVRRARTSARLRARSLYNHSYATIRAMKTLMRIVALAAGLFVTPMGQAADAAPSSSR